MGTEYEAKVLDIDVADVTERIEKAGGKLVAPEGLQRRCVYDGIPVNPAIWMRLRDNGRKATLAVKHIRHNGIDGTDEVETGIDDFTAARRGFELLGLRAKSYQENYRTSYQLDGVRLEIDRWPLIPPYLEIEGDDEQQVIAIAARLGYESDDLTSINTVDVYTRYGLDIHTFKELTFEAAMR